MGAASLRRGTIASADQPPALPRLYSATALRLSALYQVPGLYFLNNNNNNNNNNNM